MALSIVIVNYRSATHICNCLESALPFSSSQAFEWIVVDNQSNDNSREVILSRFPFVRWIDMGYNAGFARANNEGIRQAKGEVVLLLNPDTLVLDDAIARCYERFAVSDYIACGVQLLFLDGAPQIAGNFFMMGGLNHLLPLPYWGGLLRSVAFALHTKKPNVLVAAAEEKVEWINGAFLMVKKSGTEQAGLLDEDFFLYAEEIEWCSRLMKYGELCIYGDLRMIHIQGESINDATDTSDKGYMNLYDRKGLQLMVSNHVRIRKQYGVAWFLFHLFNYTWAIVVFFIASFFDRLFRGRNPFGDWGKAAGMARNVAKLWWLSPVILRNNPHFYKII